MCLCCQFLRRACGANLQHKGPIRPSVRLSAGRQAADGGQAEICVILSTGKLATTAATRTHGPARRKASRRLFCYWRLMYSCSKAAATFTKVELPPSTHKAALSSL